MMRGRARQLTGTVVAAAIACLLASGAIAASIKQWGFRENTGPAPEVDYENAEYDGRFSFVRVKFNPSQCLLLLEPDNFELQRSAVLLDDSCDVFRRSVWDGPLDFQCHL